MLSIENPCEISQLKACSDDEKKGSDKLVLKDADLSNSTLEDDDDDNNPPPKFSIRDYVFGARSKNIETNWPFSKKNLQLCLKNGVKDLLPPFQTPDSVRNQSQKLSVGISSNSIRNSDGDQPSDDRKVEVNSSVSERDNDNREEEEEEEEQQEEEEEQEQTVSVSVSVPQKIHKIESRKCRLILKLSGVSDPIPSLDSTSGNKNMGCSEAMASKVCPVCKTFSSSSNTTLNAHIDQCLSGESSSPMKWIENSKMVIKHKVKPKRMRSMVEIYETAAYCTLEELDRRNGTNWAVTSSLPADKELSTVVREELSSPNHEDAAVYIDSSGTKLRILSKFNDVGTTTTSNVGDDRMKGCKRIKLLSNKKKKLKARILGPRAKGIDSPKPRSSSEIRLGEERDVVMNQQFKPQEQTKIDDLAIGRWACSKRTVLRKKSNGGDELIVRINQKSPSSGFPETPKSGLDQNNSPQTGKRNNEIFSSQPRKKREFSSMEFLGKKRHTVSRKDISPVHDPYDFQTDFQEKTESFVKNKEVEMNSGPPDGSKPINHHGLSKVKKFTSLRKNLLPVSNFGLKRKFSSLKKSQVDQKNDLFTDKLPPQKTHFLKIEKKKGSKLKNGDDDDDDEEEEAAMNVQSNPSEGEGPSEMGFGGNFMSLSGSLTPQFREINSPDSHHEPILANGHEMFYDDMIGQSSQMETDGGYFPVVDPITIPGPPGSYLPSPRDMGSEDLQGNSSLTTSRIQSSEDQFNLVDGDSSDSPVSATSTVSNFAVAKSDSSSSRKMTMVAHSVQDENRSDDVENPVLKRQVSDVGGESLKNGQPCCCSRKEGVYQPSQPAMAKQIQMGSGSNSWSEMFSIKNNNPSMGSKETVVDLPVNVSTDCDSVSPSSSNAVLRLMGKNLMVVNKEETRSNLQCSSMSGANIPDHHTAKNGFEPLLSSDPMNRYESGGRYNLHHSPFLPVASKKMNVLDDNHEREPFLATESTYNAAMANAGGYAGGVSVSRHVNHPYYSYQIPGFSQYYVGSPVMPSSSFQMPPPMGGGRGGVTAGSTVKWNCTEGGSSFSHPNSISASSSSTTRPRSTFYYPTGFS